MMRQRAWWVIRRCISFTVDELLSTLADGTERDAAGNIGKYVRALEKAGIVKRAEKRQAGKALTSPGMLRYQLVINSGRLAPIWRTNNCEVYDRNSKVVYSIDQFSVTENIEVNHE
jgi:hypothetical protein